ncbi:MAG: hypothetical protein HC845_15605, partial [Akkermansiaceae bacterium]|nr:hypothetical protein [Akkermansiaceae bacterium]
GGGGESSASSSPTLKPTLDQALEIWADVIRKPGLHRGRLQAGAGPDGERAGQAQDALPGQGDRRCRCRGSGEVPREARSNEVTRLRELGVQVIHDERESAVAMVRAAVSSYQRADIEPEEIVGDT